jgi:hypothetical protein
VDEVKTWTSFFLSFFSFFHNPLTNETEGKSERKIIKIAHDVHMMG